MNRRFFFVLALLVLLSPVRPSGSETAPFVVVVIDHTEMALLGLPAVCDLEVRNVSGVEQAVVAMELDQRFESWPTGVEKNDLPGGSILILPANLI